jgi:hypothetical protein
MAFWIGLYPKPFFQILQQPVNQLVLTVRPDYPGISGAVNAAARPQTPAVPDTAALAVASDIAKGKK